jgi:hypothetical protein
MAKEDTHQVAQGTACSEDCRDVWPVMPTPLTVGEDGRVN